MKLPVSEPNNAKSACGFHHEADFTGTVEIIELSALIRSITVHTLLILITVLVGAGGLEIVGLHDRERDSVS